MVKLLVLDTGSKIMQVGRASIKRLLFISVIILSIFVAVPITAFAQQIEGLKSRPQERPDTIREKHRKQAQPIWIIEREYQEPPTIIIRVEDSPRKRKKNRTKHRQSLKPPDPLSLKSAVIHTRDQIANPLFRKILPKQPKKALRRNQPLKERAQPAPRESKSTYYR